MHRRVVFTPFIDKSEVFSPESVASAGNRFKMVGELNGLVAAHGYSSIGGFIEATKER